MQTQKNPQARGPNCGGEQHIHHQMCTKGGILALAPPGEVTPAHRADTGFEHLC